MSDKSNGLSAVEAKHLIEKERTKRVSECIKEVEGILNKYNCQIDVSVTLRVNSVTPNVQIISKD